MLIQNATIITQNANREIIPHGYIYIVDDSIAVVGKGDYEGDLRAGEETIDASGLIVSPGFINAHVHLGETIYTGFMNGWYDLEKYIEFTNRLSTVSSTIEDARRLICDYSLLQLIRSGATTIAGGRTNESSEPFGLRNVSAYMLMQSPKLGKFGENIEEQFEKFYLGLNQSISRPALFVHSLGTVSEEMLSLARDLKTKYSDILIMAHIAETAKTEAESKDAFGLTSVHVLQKYNLLGKQTLLIHGNNLSSEDASLINRSNSSLVHCLSSNLRVADNTADIWSLLQNNISVSIATDGVATAGTFSVLSEARRCYFFHNRFCPEECHVSAQDILDMITISPAKSLRMFTEVGSIEPGKKADITLLRGSHFSRTNPVDSLITNDSIVVEGVIVGGKKLLWQDNLLVGDEQKIIDDFAYVTEKVRSDIARTTSSQTHE
ncbi:MAG: amidohydrolase family protein [Candidatus Paceibacterota bacterium]|jgi:cytosine/adenosine deaminase-related metal-dependent hydrolase